MGSKCAGRSGEFLHTFQKPVSNAVKDLIINLLRWEADPAGFCPRMNLEDCRMHPWLRASDTSDPMTPSYGLSRLSTNPRWKSARPLFFCQKLQVTNAECDGSFLQLASDYDSLGHGIVDSDFINSRCLGAATRCKRQVLSVVSLGVLVQRTQPKTLLRFSDTVYYGVANTLSTVRPAQKAYHPEFEGRLCRNAGVGFGLMECVEFHVPPHMHKCVIGGPNNRGNDKSLGWIQFRKNYGRLSIAVLQRADGTKCFYPLAIEILHEGDTLLIPRRFMDDDNSYPPGSPAWREPESLNEMEQEDEENFEETISKHALNFECEGHFRHIVEKKAAHGATLK